ncbi:MAG: hypothetical protein FD187_238 [bacterium]|nr:MAG: hypothetical protein FD142_1796 [bacterium]KAF0150392.1 MAG: hypothetical protein FD187_238 [bacterium]KAF0168949.1 MAG: hypothetical protein FD158_807 [bacterium]TXT18098.1 MAG: hypothetical protein FD132_2167 [bacterium]
MKPLPWQPWGLALLTTAAHWIGAFALVTLARLWASLYADMGGVLPAPAQWVLDAARHHIPFGIALAVTLLLVVLAWTRSHRLPLACALLTAFSLIALALAAVGLALPVSKCGVLWPAWPGTDCLP